MIPGCGEADAQTFAGVERSVDQAVGQAGMLEGARGCDRQTQSQFNLTQYDREACAHDLECARRGQAGLGEHIGAQIPFADQQRVVAERLQVDRSFPSERMAGGKNDMEGIAPEFGYIEAGDCHSSRQDGDVQPAIRDGREMIACVTRHNLDLDMGMGTPKAVQKSEQGFGKEGRGQADLQPAQATLTRLAGLCDRVAQQIERVLYASDEGDACESERRAARVPVEQGDADFVLQPPYAPAKGGLFDAKGVSGLTKTACAGHGEGPPQGSKI